MYSYRRTFGTESCFRKVVLIHITYLVKNKKAAKKKDSLFYFFSQYL
jgi:hypothetical protein